MKILSFIEDPEVIKKILKHLGMWTIKARPPPRTSAPSSDVSIDSQILRSRPVRIISFTILSIQLRLMPLEDPVSGGDDFSKPAKGSNGVVCPD